MPAVKKPKAPPIEITPEMVERASNSSFMLDLLNVASSISRGSIRGPFITDLPILTSAWIKEKNDYRRVNIPAHTSANVREIVIGKKNGLIFRFDVTQELKRNANELVEFFEIGWDDVINTMGDFAEIVEESLRDGVTIKSVDERLRGAIKQNPAMHKILSDGFITAMAKAKEKAMDEGIRDLPGFGSFLCL